MIERERVTYLPGTPTAFIAMMDSPDFGQRDLSSIKLTMSAGANCPVEVIRAVRDRFSGMFIEAFGMNEFGMGFWAMLDDDPDEVAGTIGRAIRGVEARVVDGDGRPLPNGETGELVIKSAGMCAGYFDNVVVTGKPDPEWVARTWRERLSGL